MVMAYVMESLNLDCPAAYRIVKTAHEISWFAFYLYQLNIWHVPPASFPCCPDLSGDNTVSSPNSGFVSQLKLFHSMQCTLQQDNPEFKLYKYKKFTDAYEGRNGCVTVYMWL